MSNLKRKQVAIISVIAVPVLAMTGYCGYLISNTGKSVAKADVDMPSIERPLSDSDRVWGASPVSACKALENANIITSDYVIAIPDKKLYGCKTSEIEIPDQKAKKTIQYVVTGFSDKATNIKLILKINGDQSTKESIVAKKTWAIYSAVLAETVFSQQLTEPEMQRLANFKDGDVFKKNHNLQLISDVHYEKIKNVGIYTYQIRGLPVLNGG